MNAAVIVVSGLPRSGTSLMMQMLDKGGVGVVTDHIRTADTDNPKGYYEFERVKKVKEDAGWLPDSRGKAVKMVSQLLYDLPATETYRVIFMERDLDEVLASQEKMLQRLGRPAAPREQIKKSFTMHLNKLNDWLKDKKHIEILRVRYPDLVQHPEVEAKRVSDFLGGQASIEGMIQAVDPTLYRNRKAAAS
jgi:hypothetical protein